MCRTLSTGFLKGLAVVERSARILRIVCRISGVNLLHGRKTEDPCFKKVLYMGMEQVVLEVRMLEVTIQQWHLTHLAIHRFIKTMPQSNKRRRLLISVFDTNI